MASFHITLTALSFYRNLSLNNNLVPPKLSISVKFVNIVKKIKTINLFAIHGLPFVKSIFLAIHFDHIYSDHLQSQVRT